MSYVVLLAYPHTREGDMFIISESWISAYPGAHAGVLAMRGVANPAAASRTGGPQGCSGGGAPRALRRE